MADSDIPRHALLGVRVSALDYNKAVAATIDAAKAKASFGITALAVHGVMTGHQDPEQRYRLNALDIVTPDGQPVRWALNRLYSANLRDRVYGPNLMLNLCEAAANEGLPVFLFGATEDTLNKLSANLKTRFPELQIAGMKASAFRQLNEAEWSDLADCIRNSGAKLVFVGLGCPRQEIWVYEMRDKLQMPRIAVGAAFDFHAGNVRQAPLWIQNIGLEWLYRLTQDPRRLWKRYIFLNPQYMAGVFLQWLGLHSIDPNTAKEPTTEMHFG